LGTVLGLQGKLEEAIAQYQQALRLNPNFAEAYYNLGTALYKQGRQDAALTQFKQARELFRVQGKIQAMGQLDQLLRTILITPQTKLN
jgi:tetratricopeptide (TPR) repeat protein